MLNRIILFGIDGCSYTVAAKEDLARRKRPYEYHNVVKEQEALQRMLELTGGARLVPVIVEQGCIKIGFGGTCRV
ncbi:Glutaredoxin [Pelotomaculum schinkii]|uniref:Glutaredoxin n=1 Tax=Pelotomaculum schinkii TaxID=78350 RepID=A0A4Y7R8K3_9FIRM|nr:UXX-star (seleno)protein family 1 [Pelotomaculum schinkii]TEB05294.1 Glutaredoxin [Pelotomaculum schinkii]